MDEAELQEAAAAVLGFLREEGGIEPGGFTGKLIDTMLHADYINLMRLSTVFPELGACVYSYKHEPDGVAVLKARAKGELVR
jgi:hypothetical protein